MIRDPGAEWIPPGRCSLFGGLFGGGGGSSSTATTAVDVQVNPSITNVIDLQGIERLTARIVEGNTINAAATVAGAERQAQAMRATAAAESERTDTLERIGLVVGLIGGALAIAKLMRWI